MPMRFDSGLQLPIRTHVRRAILSQLGQLATPIAFVEAIEPIGFPVEGPHDELGIDLLWSVARNRSPAIFVWVGDIADEAAGAPNRTRGKLDIDLFFLSTHRNDLVDGRSEADVAATASERADPGLDTMLELAWQLLANFEIGQRASPLLRIAEKHLISDLERTIWRQQWRTLVTMTVNPNRDITDLLQQLNTTLHPVGDEPDELNITEETDVG